MLPGIERKMLETSLDTLHVVQERSRPPHRIATRRLDTNDLGPEVGEQSPGEHTGLVADFDNTEAAERWHVSNSTDARL